MYNFVNNTFQNHCFPAVTLIEKRHKRNNVLVTLDLKVKKINISISR